MFPNDAPYVAFPQRGDGYERTVRRLRIASLVLAFFTLPVIGALLTEGHGTPTVISAWRIGLLTTWAVAFIGVARCALGVLRLRVGNDRRSGGRAGRRPRRSATSAGGDAREAPC